ncbi:MAG TPA: patatin-like phospholipase family protein, partial [Crenalkalicoccus sp.]|nr:patatin-like phospholipase family protein [Crenalkalicoccus sp.]
MKTIALAVQGAGAHGAFIWGVLDRLSRERDLRISAISATSSGALNAAVYLYGLASGGAEGAREALAEFWSTVAAHALWSGNPFVGLSYFGALRNIDSHPVSIWIQQFAVPISPYNFPFLGDPLEAVATAVLRHPERLNHPDPPLFIGMTDVVNGRRAIATQPNITIPTLLASACLPANSRAVRIGESYYWDGGYMGNPPLAPLVRMAREGGARDIVMATINPFRRTDLMPPMTAPQIQDRLNEITFNSSLVLEVNGIETVNRLLRQHAQGSPFRARDNKPCREILFHRISDDDFMRDLGFVSKANPSLPFLEELRDHGRRAAETWLRTGLDQVGRTSSFDVNEMLDRTLVAQAGTEPAPRLPLPVPMLPEIAPAKGFG